MEEAMKDRYDYYEEMERTEEVESILPWGLEEQRLTLLHLHYNNDNNNDNHSNT